MNTKFEITEERDEELRATDYRIQCDTQDGEKLVYHILFSDEERYATRHVARDTKLQIYSNLVMTLLEELIE